MIREIITNQGNSIFTLPIILWTNDYVFRGYKLDDPWILSKSTVRDWNKYCKIMRILDASGKCFSIARWEEVPPKSRIAAFMRRWSWNTSVIPIITREKQLDLEAFKKEVKRAVAARQRHDFDSNILSETMENLPSAKTYLQAIESLPKLI